MDSNEIYSLRNKFSIVGLTGKTGSGCTRFAEIISKGLNLDKTDVIRKPSDIIIDDELTNDNINDKKTISELVLFERKYSICYNYYQIYHSNYQTISYISALLHYVLHFCVHSKDVINEEGLFHELRILIDDNYKKSIKSIDIDYPIRIIDDIELKELCYNTLSIITNLKKLNSSYEKINNDELDILYDSFFGVEFEHFSKRFYGFLGQRDYYLGSFFVHRIGNKIRATGNPFDVDNLESKADVKNIYNVARVINKLIKSYKLKNEYCHICIDALRNSLEIMFFKERYSAFYLISVHNKDRHFERLKARVAVLSSKIYNNSEIEIIVKKTQILDEIEYKVGDFKRGLFYSPDVENCIQKSEIHIMNPGKDCSKFDIQGQKTSFYTMAEQWIKIKTLMFHPGIITPSHEERCMQIAYNLKYNSGCISRQVGAIITDENNSIRSVGWNDVPKGSIPCILRNLGEVIDSNSLDKRDLSYSDFELDRKRIIYKDGSNFSINSEKIYSAAVTSCANQGLNFSFCFKNLHNRFEEKDNQVHTRSLHAEENAMLQISKYGGQPLKNGKLFTTASPCELCSKKAYQLGIKEIIYIDPYPGISISHILRNGYNRPNLKMFTGIIGRSYNKLFEPFLAFKDELNIVAPINQSVVNNIDNLKNNLESMIGRKLRKDISEHEIVELFKDY